MRLGPRFATVGQPRALARLGRAVQASAPPVVSFDSGLINNGGMDDASGWTLGGDAAISGGVLSATVSGTATRIVDNATLVPGSWYQLDGTISAVGSTTFTLGGKAALANPTSTGAFTIYMQAGAIDNTLAVSTGGGASIDKLALTGPKTVTLGSTIISNGTFDDGTNWALGTGMTISGGTLNMAGSATNQRATNTPVSAPVVGTYYQMDLTISARTSGLLAVAGPFGNTASFAASGTSTVYGFATGTANPYIVTRSSSTLSADNFVMRAMTFS